MATTIHLRDERPEDPAPAHRQQRWQHQQHRCHRDQQPDRGRDGETAGQGDRGQQQGQQCQHHGRVRCHHCGGHASPGSGQRDPVIGLGVQLLAVPGDQQQRVVGARPEHEHADDAGIELEAPVGPHRGGDPTGEAVGQHDHHQRHQPQHGGAVGEDQQGRHDQDRHRQQGEVRTVEGGGDIGPEGGTAGDLQGDSLDRVVSERGAQGVDGLGCLGVVRPHGDRCDQQGRLPVLAHHRSRGLRCRVLTESGQQSVQCLQVVGSEGAAIGPAGHHQHRLAIRIRELLQQGTHPCRFGIHRGMGAARWGIGPAQQTEQRHHQHQGDGQYGPRTAARGEQGGQGMVHACSPPRRTCPEHRAGGGTGSPSNDGCGDLTAAAAAPPVARHTHPVPGPGHNGNHDCPIPCRPPARLTHRRGALAHRLRCDPGGS